MHLIECPRDAMQGIKAFIPTDRKIRYLNALLRCGFHTLDFGSFVSPKAIPQMRDTAEVLAGLSLDNSETRLLAIVANVRGAVAAAEHPEIDYLGYPLSVSENFQMRNTHKTIGQSLDILAEIFEIAQRSGKEVVTYLSMAFGNPYGDPWSPEIVAEYTDRIRGLGARIVSVSDTIGAGTPEVIRQLIRTLVPAYPDLEIGVHLHSNPRDAHEKIRAACESGCRRVDSAIQGYGGCPMARDELTGNMPTEKVITYLESAGIPFELRMPAFESAYNEASDLFGEFH